MSDNLPPEILGEIFFKLPIKCLVKCVSVCKLWRSIIINPIFIDAHAIQPQKQGYNTFTLLLAQESVNSPINLTYLYEFYSMRSDYPTFDEYIALGKSPLICEPQFDTSVVVGICNGLVCLADLFLMKIYNCMLWNPSIHKFLPIPKPNMPLNSYSKHGYTHYGFGFDCFSNDYKLVKIFTFLPPGQFESEIQVDVYSLNMGYWYTLDVEISQLKTVKNYSGIGVFVNGFLYWQAKRHTNIDESNSKFFILCFDVENEYFEELPMPSGSNRGKGNLFEFGELLGMYRQDDDNFRVWVMDEYGVTNPWTLLLSIAPILSRLGTKIARCLWKRENKLIVCCGFEVFSIDLNTKQCEDYNTGKGFVYIGPYLESLVLLDHSGARSHQIN